MAPTSEQMGLKVATFVALLALVSLGSVESESFGCDRMSKVPSKQWIAYRRASVDEPNSFALASFIGYIEYESESNSERTFLPLQTNLTSVEYQPGTKETLTLVKDCAKLVLKIEKVPIPAGKLDTKKKQVTHITVMTRVSSKEDDFVELCHIEPTNMDFDMYLHYSSSYPYSKRSFECKSPLPSRGATSKGQTVAKLVLEALEFEICHDENSHDCRSKHEQGKYVTKQKPSWS